MKCCRSGGVQRCYFNSALATRVATFDSVALTANPGNFGVQNIPFMANGNYSGLSATTVNVPADGSDNGMVFDFNYVIPRDRITDVRITTNYGGILNDGDNIFNPDIQLFDVNNVALTPVFTALANNGGGFFVTPVPGGPIDGVARVRMTNIRGNIFPPITKGIREVEMMQQGLSPAALVYCPDEAEPLFWINPITGALVPASDLTDCR